MACVNLQKMMHQSEVFGRLVDRFQQVQPQGREQVIWLQLFQIVIDELKTVVQLHVPRETANPELLNDPVDPNYQFRIFVDRLKAACIALAKHEPDEPTALQKLWEACLNAEKIVSEWHDQLERSTQNTETANTSIATAPTDGRVSVNLPIEEGEEARVNQRIHQFQKHYSHFDVAPAQRAEDRPRDIRAPTRGRINRVTKTPIEKPELVLIGCTEGRDLDAQIELFEKSGMGPNYVITKDGQLKEFVKAELCAWWGNPACWHGVPPTYSFPGVGTLSEVHYYSISVALEGDGDKDQDEDHQSHFTDQQYKTLVEFISDLQKAYQIKPWNILGLAEVCMPPNRYASPGRHFDWKRLSDVTFDAEPLQHQNGDGTSEDVEKLMIKWGYGLGEGEEATNSIRLASFGYRYGCEGKEQCEMKLRALIDARDQTVKSR
ncbi:unnamed protein product [Durusdinium trenchii]|uniref:N-acetylmuramoyl-L-alanine amidase n=1 Tax=Durusdinium trenchii TaxID=1381693 RepID=A0ABP0RDI4_9DINO